MSFLFLGISLVLAHELINTSSGVNQFQLTRVEGVGGVGDLELQNRIFVTVGIGDGLFGGCTAFGQNHVAVRHVFENDQAVVRGMDSFFHLINFLPFKTVVLQTIFITNFFKFESAKVYTFLILTKYFLAVASINTLM